MAGMCTVPSNRSDGSATRSRDVPLAVNAGASNVLLSTISLRTLYPFPFLDFFAHQHDPVSGTCHRAADVDQILLAIHALDPQTDLRVSRRAVVAGHLLAL